jgi:hypothetical protein
MDLPLSARVTSSAADPASGGGLVSFSGSSAAELQRAAADVLDAYGDPAVVPTAGGTPATFIRGMSLEASASGTVFVCTLQIEPDETTLTTTPYTFPLDQQVPINARFGTFNELGWSRIQFIEGTDAAELARRNNWANDFWLAETNRTGQQPNNYLLYEQIVAAPFNRQNVVALLWSFQDLSGPT